MCQACLTRARTWAQQQGPSRGPGACFGPEVTCILGCGQLGPVCSFYSWVLGSDTKYGVACVWHPHLWQAWLKWYILAPQRVQTCPPPTPRQSQIIPAPPRASLHPIICPCPRVVHIGLKILRTRISSFPKAGNTRFLVHTRVLPPGTGWGIMDSSPSLLPPMSSLIWSLIHSLTP